MVLRAQHERYRLRASPYLWAFLGPRDPPPFPALAPPVSLAALGGDQRAGAKSTSLINNNLTKEVIMEAYQGNQVRSALVENYLASCRHQAASCQLHLQDLSGSRRSEGLPSCLRPDTSGAGVPR